MGQWWTWERGKTVSTRVRKRLDRYLASPSWCQLYPNATVEHLLHYRSDHTPIVVRTKEHPKRKRRRGKIFKFETAWLLDESCESVVKNAWESVGGTDIVRKLESVGSSPVTWSKEKFDDLGKQIEKTERALKIAQQRDISDEICLQCSELEKILDDLHCKPEAYWYLCYRVLEVRDEDRNTSYFHHKASQRKKRNTITGLFDGDGVWQGDEEKIENIVSSYYTDLFDSSKPTDSNMQVVLQHVQKSFLDDHNVELLKPYKKEEIYAALQQMQMVCTPYLSKILAYCRG